MACEPSGLAGPVCQRLVRTSRGMAHLQRLELGGMGTINNFTRLPRAGRAVGHVSTQRRLAPVVGWLLKLVGFLGVQSSNSLDVQVEMGIQFYQFIRLQIDFYKCKPNQLNPLRPCSVARELNPPDKLKSPHSLPILINPLVEWINQIRSDWFGCRESLTFKVCLG